MYSRMKIRPSDSGHDEHQAALGVFHLLELAAPDRPVRGVEETFVLSPCLGDGAAQVAARGR